MKLLPLGDTSMPRPPSDTISRSNWGFALMAVRRYWIIF